MDDFIGNWVKFGVFQKKSWCSSYLQSLAQNHCVNFFMSKVWKYEQILLTLNSISPILGVAKHFLMHFYFNWKLLPHRKNSKVNKQTINWKKLWNSGLVGWLVWPNCYIMDSLIFILVMVLFYAFIWSFN